MIGFSFGNQRLELAGQGRRFLALFVALALVWLAACSSPKEKPIARGATVLVLGDSITAGFGLTPEQSWAAHLQQASGWNVINGGVSGDTTEQGLARLPGLLEQHRPAAVIIELGGNDMLRRQTAGAIGERLVALIDAVRLAGARPVLMAVPSPSLTGAVFSKLYDAPFYLSTAEKMSVPLISDAISETLSKSDFRLDALHPNARGHEVLAEKAAARLRSLGLLK